MWRRQPRASNTIQQPSGKCRAAAVSFIAAVVISATVLSNSRTNPALNLDDNTSRQSVELRPSVARRNGTSVIWQMPSSLVIPKAALFLAHGCGGKAENFWDRSPLCPNCVGLPEERRIVLGALGRGFAVVAVSSRGKCWSLRKEVEVVRGILRWWFDENRLGNLPLVAMGASSGGYFVSALAATMKFRSVAIMIAEGVFDEMGVPAGYPPTLFVHMPKDVARAAMVKRNMEALKKKGVDAKEIQCMEFPLTPSILSERVPGVDRMLSATLFRLLQDKGFVNDKGYMTADGRAIPWMQGFKGGKPARRVDELRTHIQEELNLAFAYHEMTSLPMGEILEWFESHQIWKPSPPVLIYLLQLTF